jgi:hypothetical protein
VISPPGQAKATGGGLKAELRTQGHTQEDARYHRGVDPEPTTAAGARKRRESQFSGYTIVELGFANIMYDRLTTQIDDFEKDLNNDKELGAYLASFGREILVRISGIV